MTIADVYPWLKALHVTCALLFAGGVIANNLVLVAGHAATDRISVLMPALGRWDKKITTPAMLGLWAFGVGLSVSGAWFAYGWLQVKLVFVVLLSAIHGLQSGQIRRLALGDGVEPMRIAALAVPAMIAITVLAVVKP